MAQRIQMTWEILSDDDPDAGTGDDGWLPDKTHSVRRRSDPRRGLLAVSILLLVYAWLGYDRIQIQRGTDADMGQEDFTRAVEVQIRVLDPQTRVEAQVVADNGLPAHRQVRFYSKSVNGWQETPPTLQLWGQEQTIRTDFLVLQYRRLDKFAAQEAAAHLDARFVAVRRAFGLPLPLDGERIRLQVGLVSGFQDRGRRQMQLLSPLRLPVPESVTDGELLVQSAQSVIIDWAIVEMLNAQLDPTAGALSSAMLNALRLWGQWQTGAPLA